MQEIPEPRHMANNSKPAVDQEEIKYHSFNLEHDRSTRKLIGRLSNPGASGVVCSPNQDLRNHYVREIVSNVFEEPRNSTVMRAPKDRESIVSLISEKIEENSASEVNSKVLGTIWIYEAEFADEVEKIALISKLIRQFKASGISLVVNCSGVVQRSKDFRDWVQKNKTLVEEFAVPNDAERDSFLETADEQGGIYSARELVARLSLPGEEGNPRTLPAKTGVSSAAIKRDRADVISISTPSENLEKVGVETISRNIEKEVKASRSKKKSQELDSRSRRGMVIAKASVTISALTLLIGCVWFVFEKDLRSSFHDIQKVSASLLNLPEVSVEPDEEFIAQPSIQQEAVDADLADGSQVAAIAGSVEILGGDVSQTETASETIVGTSETGSDTVSEEVALTVSKIEEPAELFFLQAGAFSRKLNAERFVRMNGTGSSGYFVVQKKSGLWSPVLGPFERLEAERLINEPRENQLVLRTTEEFQLNKAG